MSVYDYMRPPQIPDPKQPANGDGATFGVRGRIPSYMQVQDLISRAGGVAPSNAQALRMADVYYSGGRGSPQERAAVRGAIGGAQATIDARQARQDAMTMRQQEQQAKIEAAVNRGVGAATVKAGAQAMTEEQKNARTQMILDGKFNLADINNQFKAALQTDANKAMMGLALVRDATIRRGQDLTASGQLTDEQRIGLATINGRYSIVDQLASEYGKALIAKNTGAARALKDRMEIEAKSIMDDAARLGVLDDTVPVVAPTATTGMGGARPPVTPAVAASGADANANGIPDDMEAAVRFIADNESSPTLAVQQQTSKIHATLVKMGYTPDAIQKAIKNIRAAATAQQQ